MYVHTLLYNACSATPFKVHGHCHVRETQILKQRNQRSACSDCGNIHYSKTSCANAAAKAAGKPKADKRTRPVLLVGISVNACESQPTTGLLSIISSSKSRIGSISSGMESSSPPTILATSNSISNLFECVLGADEEEDEIDELLL